ncbi:PH domain-containing protein [Salinibacter sp.]|jgi:membrane protein YdbS with pleckstrin-like domain|uniref:PH domain-containing protein n=1 Tax=Salinibacter sp. TaxID=2065818 RepID=UPI0021E72B5A|nr:PH domain-containing protein [Salinibacter sp.]
MTEDVIFRAQPRLWKAHPFSVTLFGLLSATVAPFVLGGALVNTGWTAALMAGLCGPLPLLWMWLQARSRELVVTRSRVRKRSGILSNRTTELAHRNIRNVQIDQGPIHRLMQCGTLRLSSAGQSGIELTMRDLDDPEAVRDLIYQQHG